ncbi:hypothetical protein E0Z10_g1453 [Xylaria hypoxylon]|uniref:Mid2 domain-containing protein n=1 Tax=Xylaria hypoxylon TaxID=37992 RepID=A0A4Z0YSD8_9PEZI|nr:hypothetical protein E0Z10_g1453 [Xylaria hypoxylon]
MGGYVAKRALALAFALFTAPCWAIGFTTTEFRILPGQPFTLTWEDAKGPVELSLLTGGSTTLTTVEVIDSGDTGNSYTWTPPDDLPSGTYAFGISDGDDMNYSPQWTYKASNNARLPNQTSWVKVGLANSKQAPASSSSSILTPTSTSTTPTKLSTTTVSATSSKITTSSTSSPTTKSSISLKPTPTTSPSADTSSNNILTSSTIVSSIAPSTSSESPISEPTDSSSTSNSSFSSSSSAPSTETRKPVANANGLSMSAKIGIGVGAGVGSLGLLIVAMLLIFRSYKAAKRRDVNDDDTANQELKAELGGDPRPRAELGGQDLAAMRFDQTIPELWQGHHDEWRRQPSELDASSHSY